MLQRATLTRWALLRSFNFNTRGFAKQKAPRGPASSLHRPARDLKKPKSLEDLVKPIPVVTPSQSNELADFDGVDALNKDAVSLILAEFSKRPTIRELAEENGISAKLFMKAFLSFRQHCMKIEYLDPALKVTLSDILNHNHSVDSLFVFFLGHAWKVYPHLESLEDLKLISDLTQPHNWYPEARTIQRKIVFHAGPTNSGKTYAALERFKTAETGVYCGPLRLLANEVFMKMNAAGLPCDLVTGEERCFAVDNMNPANHLSSTVEMLSTAMPVEVAVIDEIQMLRDDQRGWAWTRALLGVAAQEVHVCGEKAAIEVVKRLLDPIGEHVEVFEYERRSPLSISTHGLADLRRLEDGDCIVCFSRKAIFNITKQLERLSINCAVIYGDLPPGAKLAQAAKFNDPEDPVNVLVATDAIGMGLNLNIKRVIFNSLVKPPRNQLIPTFAALQIAGRAGRYGTAYADGKVMTMRNEDMGLLKNILSQPVPDIDKVGIAPTFEQIETFAYHLPQASFVNLLDIFTSVCSISDEFFICSVQQIRDLAELIDSIPLPLKDRYTFCLVPIKPDRKVVASAFVKMVRRFSTGQPISFDWFCSVLNWPLAPAEKVADLMHLEQVYDIVDAYLWLSLRMMDAFPDEELVRGMERDLDELIQDGVDRLLANHGDISSGK
uniref:ATP-dependent RNA helicase SUV3 homolog, mitochondrial n=1 Tax=Panagrellus redivivus TaxID=6233 RepID=A0A7E4ZPZ0_PANRE